MKKVIKVISKAIEIFLVIMMAVMVVVVFLATLGRYTHLFSIPWSEELARYCMVWIVYLGLMLASEKDAHYVVEVIPLIFRKKPLIIKIFSVIDAIIVDIFGIFILKQGYIVSAKMMKVGKTSPMLHVPLGVVYFVIPIGLLLMAIFYTVRTIEKCMGKTGPMFAETDDAAKADTKEAKEDK